MTVYCGSNADFDKVSFGFAKDRRDFGRGFYTTTIKEQAEEWAENTSRRYKSGIAYLYEFELSLTGLAVKIFDTITTEWLEFIIENRIKGGIQHSFDVVTGPVANDRTMDTIGFYLAGILTMEEALSRLKYMDPNDQVSLHTDKALSNLFFTRKAKWTV